MPDGADTLKKGRKYDQVLRGAWEVFMSDGFEGASVDDIAREAGVSKATLYSYFPDKRLLFLEVARLECDRQAQEGIAQIDPSKPIDELLRDVATHFVEFITSDFGQRIFRICVAESARFPELGQAFYETGPKAVHRILVQLFNFKISEGELAISDVELAADQFPELCKAQIFPALVFNMKSSYTPAEKNRIIEGAVETFMARYGA